MRATPITVFATFQPQRGKEEALLSVLATMVDHTRREPGNELYSLYSSGDGDDRTFHLFERYTSSEALDAHRRADYYKAYRAAVPELLDEPIAVQILDEVDVRRA